LWLIPGPSINLPQISMKLSFGKWESVFEADAFHWQVDMVGFNMLAHFSQGLYREPEVGSGVEDVEGDINGFTYCAQRFVDAVVIVRHALRPKFAAAPRLRTH
jgi:hypothetical protein